MEDEESRSTQGEQLLPRTRDAIKLYLYNIPPGIHSLWVESRRSTLLSHLKNCIHHPREVRERARMELSSNLDGADTNFAAFTAGTSNPQDVDMTPRTQCTYSSAIVSPRPISFHQAAPVHEWTRSANVQLFGNPTHPHAQAVPTHMHLQPSNPFAPSEASFYLNAPPPGFIQPASTAGASLSSASPSIPSAGSLPTFTQEAISRMYNASPAQSYISTSSSVSSNWRSLPSVSRAHTPLYVTQALGHVDKRQRTASGAAKRPASVLVMDTVTPIWDQHRQLEFETSLMRLIASAGLSFNFVTNPEFLSFCQTWIPAARVPSRKSLTYHILPDILGRIRAKIKAEVLGKLVMVQCDGWTGPNSHHLIAFMITMADRHVYTVKVYDTTVEQKTAENLLALMLKVMGLLKNEWHVLPIAFTTDASGESKKARRLLQEQHPYLVTPDCYCHQVNLIVGDYFKTNNVDFLQYASQANELITWLQSKTAILGLIRQALETRGQHALSVICPVPTRWTAYYLAYRRLLDLRTTLEIVIAEDALRAESDRLVIPKEPRAAREKAKAMISIVKDNFFWLSLVCIKHHLAPLAIAANVTQSAHCRLDEVLVTFASLVMEYSKLTEAIDAEIKDALLSSIEKRWNNSDQVVFIAAVLLNPFLRTAPFIHDAQLLSLGSIHLLLGGLWTRFFGEEAPDQLYDDIRGYLTSRDFFSSLETVCNRHRTKATSRNQSPSPLEVYADITIADQEPPPLIRLAIHILSICPNSASCERLFSTFGLILTKLRTRLQNQRVVDLAECKMHVRDEQMEKKTKENIRKRVFGAREEHSTSPNTTTSLPTTANLTPSLSSTAPSTTEPDPDSDSSAPGSTRTTQSLRNLTSRHIALLEEIDSDNSTAYALQAHDGFRKRKISDLFNFTSNHWLVYSQRSAVGSLEDEMNLYDLLDLDAEGDLDYDLDDALESVLTV